MSESYLSNLTPIALQDASELVKKDKEYGSSWKKRGGVGAFMMLARKWDRIEKRMEEGRPGAAGQMTGHYDIFDAIHCDPRTEGILDDIRDLRRYLLLVEAEMVARGIVAKSGEGAITWTVGAGKQLNASGGGGGSVFARDLLDANTLTIDKLGHEVLLNRQDKLGHGPIESSTSAAAKHCFGTVDHPAPHGYDEKEG